MQRAERRIGAETSATRAKILDATAQLIMEQGYGAISTRRVAARAGLKPSLVHYYFPTTDDLLLEVSRKGAQDSDRMLDEAFAADDPLKTLWDFFVDTSRVAITLEFMALANHREALREHMAEHSREMRERQVKVLRELFGERIDRIDGLTPEALSVVLAGIGRAIVMEANLGLDDGHAAAREYVEQWLDRLVGDHA